MGFDLRQHLNISQRQEQRLVMTQNMQQAIAMLQLQHLELIEQINQELVENPLLEQAEDGSSSDPDTSSDGDDSRLQSSQLPTFDEYFKSDNTEKQPPADSNYEELPSMESMTVSQEEKVMDNMDVDWKSYVEESMTWSLPSGPNFQREDEETPIESRTASKPSLAEHLMWQLNVGGYSDHEKVIGEFIIGNLDHYGYLKNITVEEMAEQLGYGSQTIENVLKKVQFFDPPGVGARNLSECLYIQAEYFGWIEGNELLGQMILHHIPELERKDYAKIARAQKADLEDVQENVRLIQGLDPRPGRAYSSEDINYITPDVYVIKRNDRWEIELNDDGLPKLRISGYYRRALSGGPGKEYVEDKLRKAKWIIQAIEKRQETIKLVAEAIVKFQNEFFDRGASFLRPLTLRDVAEDIGRHESTVSRVTTNKYMHSPQGLFELKYFFNSAVTSTDGDDFASEAVKEKIKKLIDSEDPAHPHSDQKIADLLSSQGIEIARRTVHKYREQMNILSSGKRKQIF
ncbi:RNA polymerase factor sigma-54 [Myxococcota bacterium]|nr:RNA polymerase factor sigma-54 [Myxococcota bacterium]MBU1381564.1 RNA polymerase factor sigma-54 [Myxococcota bacterium]MBU1496072.1 RNA polymerase factor sigma-54 [Myxococcota bacterium]